MFNLLSKVSLSSWDEAWYGVISKNIVKSGNFLSLTFNNKPFYDHPPFAFWLQAISMKLFGISEFSVRLPSFILGLGTIFVLYLLGKNLFSKTAGFFSGLALLTAPWFLTRSLSGNLDIPLTFFFVLSFYFGIKAREDYKFLNYLAVSLAFLFLIKSLVPFTILPVVIYILWRKVKIKQLILPIILFLIITAPWFVVNMINNPDLIHRYLSIGYPGNKTSAGFIQNIFLTKTYLHNGIGNIFIYGFLALVSGLLFLRKRYFPLAVFIATFLFPFTFSNKGHIWHLIPLYPFWILSFFGILEIILNKLKIKGVFRFLTMSVIFILILFSQIKRNWYEIINVPTYISDLEILSTKSREYNYPLLLDDDAVPEVLFYSGKDSVERTYGRGDLRNKFNQANQFLLITRDWRLDEESIMSNEYTVITKDRDKVLILKNED